MELPAFAEAWKLILSKITRNDPERARSEQIFREFQSALELEPPFEVPPADSQSGRIARLRRELGI